ncbi:MAG: metallophosphoesterase family protein [Nitrospirota bacterium]
MRYAIITDVHANLEALNAVLEDLRYKTANSILFLGDSVGYGPNPNECIEVLRETASVLIAGNHDRAVTGLTDIEYFNPNARTAIEWTKDILTEDNKTFLKSLPIFKSLEIADEIFVCREGIKDNKKNPPCPPLKIPLCPPLLKGDVGGLSGGEGGFLDIYLVHSTPKEPEQWHYLIDTQDAYVNFHFFTERICLIGHSHQPAIIEQGPEGKIMIYRDKTDLLENHRYIINAGSVGQPRDGNPDACYAILNENSVEIKRVSYDILSTQKKMRDAGLPLFLIERLARGL